MMVTKPKLWELHAYSIQSNKKNITKFSNKFDDAHLLSFFSHLLPTLRIHPKIRLHFYSVVTSFFVWKVLVSTSIDVRETCTDHTKYKAIKRIHSFILPQNLTIIPKPVMAFKQVHWWCPLLKFLSHLPMLLLLPTFFWSTQKFGVPSTQLWQD